MALITCPECGKQISDQAVSCPHCGAPRKPAPAPAPPKNNSGCIVLLLIGALVVILISVGGRQESSTSGGQSGASSPQANTQKPSIDVSDTAQAERKELLAKMGKAGVIRSYECRSQGATVVTGPAFAQMDFASKQSFVSVVYAYCLGNQPYSSVRIHDGRTNKLIGKFNRVSGLEME